jgi:hypothetical protein
MAASRGLNSEREEKPRLRRIREFVGWLGLLLWLAWLVLDLYTAVFSWGGFGVVQLAQCCLVLWVVVGLGLHAYRFLKSRRSR